MSRLLIGGPSEPPKQQGVDPPRRLEIHDFVNDEKYFSLYIQALQNLYKKQTTEVNSWFQIGGIHGVNVSWNDSPAPGSWYCVHGLPTFSTWHRGYVALIEQEIQKEALVIAAAYHVDSYAWKKAAEDLRQPYWGWDEYSTFIPPTQILSDTEVEITVASGQQVERKKVTNPWLSYTFPADKQGEFGEKTYRRSNLESTLESLRDNTDFLDKVENVYLATEWNDFSNRLERNPHNTIHVQVGGTMATFWSSFDPIFWLHHTQVDRVLYKWYNIHQIFTADTRTLNPFWETQVAYWLSPGLREVNLLNYQYATPPLIINLPTGLTLPQRRLRASKALTSFVENPEADPTETLHHISEDLGVPLPDDKIHPNEKAREDILSDALDRGLADWRVRVSVKKYEVGGSFSVYGFFGEVPADPKGWNSDKSLVGTFDVFANSTPEKCGNCVDQVDKAIVGYVHLSRALLERSQEGLHKSVVLPQLEKLHWAVKKADTQEAIDPKKIASLYISIERAYLSQEIGAKYPEEGKHVLFNRRADGHYQEI